MILGVSSECIVVPLNDPLHLTPVQLPVEGLGIKSCVQGYHPAYPVVGASLHPTIRDQPLGENYRFGPIRIPPISFFLCWVEHVELSICVGWN